MTEKPLPTVDVWTDGACKHNPGPGGWGAALFWGERSCQLYDGLPETTNNRMELTAVIEALRKLKCPCSVVLHTDSQYVKNGLTQWIRGWKAKGWKTADGKPVKNQELWRALDTECARHRIEWKWVKGHAGVERNELADELANKGVEAGLGRIAPSR